MAESATPEQKVIVVDFGAQYGQLIARRVRDLHVYSEIVPCDITAEEVRAIAPAAIILSGGPASVYAEDAPSIDPEILALGIPVLGFCYGQQAMAVALGGEVGHTEKGEYGPAVITRAGESALFDGTPGEQTVWMSHRDAVSRVPEGFSITSRTEVCPVASMEYPERRLFATQFHPEVRHTEFGQTSAAQLPVRRVRTGAGLDDGLHHRRLRGGHSRRGGGRPRHFRPFGRRGLVRGGGPVRYAPSASS